MDNSQPVTQTENHWRREDNLIPWQKGTSGNPAGRPNGIATLARQLTDNGRICLEYLLSVVLDTGERPRFRIDAAVELLNRGYGKPTQAIDVNSDGTQPLRIIIELPQAEPTGVDTIEGSSVVVLPEDTTAKEGG